MIKLSEIEKYYNGEIHVDFDEEIEELKADIEEYRDSTTWWSNRFNAVERDNRELRKEIKRLKSIIKEVREKVEGVKKINNEVYKQTDMLERFYSRKWCNDEMDSFLQIIEKENKDGER